MRLGTSLAAARKKSGLSQEDVAAKLGVSRQTISKWETDETLPDIRQAKKLAGLYHRTLDELIDFDADLEAVEQAIHSISEEKQREIDWTAVWGKMYPVLTAYRQTVDVPAYAAGRPARPLRLQPHRRPAGPQGHPRQLLGAIRGEQKAPGHMVGGLSFSGDYDILSVRVLPVNSTRCVLPIGLVP